MAWFCGQPIACTQKGGRCVRYAGPFSANHSIGPLTRALTHEDLANQPAHLLSPTLCSSLSLPLALLTPHSLYLPPCSCPPAPATMDKVKEKMDKMRREADAAVERADDAERRLKEVRAHAREQRGPCARSRTERGAKRERRRKREREKGARGGAERRARARVP